MENVVTLTSKSKLVGPMKTELQVREFHPFHIDEPKEFGGNNDAPNPMEYMLSGLNGCETVMLQMIAQELGLKIENITINTQGQIDIRGLQGVKGIRPHFQAIKQDFTVEGASDPEKIEQLFKLMKERCPAYNLMVDAQIPVEISYTVNNPAM